MRNYPNWLKAYIDYTAFSESPTQFHFWTAVSTIAGALRRRVWRDELLFHWTPNFYIVIVGPPGVAAKSTSIRMGLSLLEHIEGVNLGPQNVTWQSLLKSLQDAMEQVEIPGHPDEFMSCITISISELGNFLNPSDDGLVSTLTDMWDGQKTTFEKKTLTQGSISVKNPWLNIIACTTPSWIRTNFPETLIEGGLTSRIIFVYGEKKRHLTAYPSQHVPGPAFQAMRTKLIEDLQQISMMRGPYLIDPEALRWGEQWYAELNTNRPPHLASDRLSGYVARKQGHLHKLAMVVAAAKRNELVIRKEDLEESDEYLSIVESSMLKVFTSIGMPISARVSSEILTIVRNYKKIDYQTLWRMCMGTTPPKEFVEALYGLRDAGLILIAGQKPNYVIHFTGRSSTTPG